MRSLLACARMCAHVRAREKPRSPPPSEAAHMRSRGGGRLSTRAGDTLRTRAGDTSASATSAIAVLLRTSGVKPRDLTATKYNSPMAYPQRCGRCPNSRYLYGRRRALPLSSSTCSART